MGLYLNPGAVVGKADQLIELGAKELMSPPATIDSVADDKAIVCVVENGPFDAAAWAFNDRELSKDLRDMRPKRWLVMDKKYVEENAT